MKDLSQQMVELKGLVVTLTELVNSLVEEVRAIKPIELETGAMTPERRRAIELTARAAVTGDPRARKQWNQERRRELEAGRPQGPRS